MGMNLTKNVRRFALLAGVWLSVASLPGAEVMVFAAASLTDSLRELATSYGKRTGVRIILNLGASSTLARQIEEGAPADIFFSADEAKMDHLERQGLIVKGTRQSRLSNSLVLIVAAAHGAAIRSPTDLAEPAIKRIALSDPKAVPAGVYAREYLTKLGLWNVVSPKVVATENVRAALAAVEAGDADASIVYKTDAMISKKVRVVFEVPVAEGPKISYPVAVLKEARSPEAAGKFLEFLASEESAGVFVKYGFRVPGFHGMLPRRTIGREETERRIGGGREVLAPGEPQVSLTRHGRCRRTLSWTEVDGYRHDIATRWKGGGWIAPARWAANGFKLAT
jgi:molybdate transport system substrate-binding protein